jgi:hypothetical protein
VAEFVQVVEEGQNYEEALGKCTVKMKDVCGQPNAQVLRMSPNMSAPIPMIDWILDQSETTISLGGNSVRVVASFFLWGSDGEDE